MNVYLFQIPATYDNNSPVYIPYSVGLLWAYAQKSSIIKRNYNLCEIFFLRENPHAILDRFQNPDVVGLSCYVWNMNYNMYIAKKIKEKWPNCSIIVGGPHVPVRDKNFFKTHPYVDIAIYREGEITFTKTLEHLASKANLENIPGLGINNNGTLIRTNEPTRTQDLDEIPSPYLLGLFEGMKQKCDHLGLTLNGLIETNRGCPYKCTFCDWGNGSLGKVKRFHLKRVKKELVWLAKNQIEFISNCDANFGIFKERDYELTNFMVKLKKRYGYPVTFDTNWPKDNNSKSVEIAELLLNNDMLRRFTASIQSENAETLTAIKRKNLPNEKIKGIIDHAKQLDIDTNVELLIGLPMDTYSNFQKTFVDYIEKGAYPTTSFVTILPNSEMAEQDYQNKYQLITKTNEKKLLHINEKDELIVQTSTMKKNEIEKLVLWCWFIQQFHFLGYTNVVLDFFVKRYGIGLAEFYEQFVDLVCIDIPQYPNKEISIYRNHIDDNLSLNLKVGDGNIGMHNRLGHLNRENTFTGIQNIVQQMSPGEDPQLIKDVVKLQNFSQYNISRSQQCVFDLKYNVLEYLYYDENLQAGNFKYNITQHQQRPRNYGEFLVRSRFTRGWENSFGAPQNVHCPDKIQFKEVN